jgi:hypothetical protein
MNEQPKSPSGADATPGGAPGPMAQNAAERLAIIIDAVEHAAAGVIDDAEAQARQHLAQAKTRADRIAAERIAAITELTDGLLGQAEEVKRQADELIAAFSAANAELSGTPAEESPEQASEVATPEAEAEAGVEPEAGAGREARIEREAGAEPPPPAAEEAGGARPQLSHLKPVGSARQGRSQPPRSVGTRLLVTQMAISGSSRGEIEARLRNELGVKDTSQVVDAILGPED